MLLYIGQIRTSLLSKKSDRPHTPYTNCSNNIVQPNKPPTTMNRSKQKRKATKDTAAEVAKKRKAARVSRGPAAPPSSKYLFSCVM